MYVSPCPSSVIHTPGTSRPQLDQLEKNKQASKRSEAKRSEANKTNKQRSKEANKQRGGWLMCITCDIHRKLYVYNKSNVNE